MLIFVYNNACWPCWARRRLYYISLLILNLFFLGSLLFFCCLSSYGMQLPLNLVLFWSFMCSSRIVCNILKMRLHGVIYEVISHKYLDFGSFRMWSWLLYEEKHNHNSQTFCLKPKGQMHMIKFETGLLL